MYTLEYIKQTTEPIEPHRVTDQGEPGDSQRPKVIDKRSIKGTGLHTDGKCALWCKSCRSCITVKSFNFVGMKFCDLTTLDMLWTLEFVDFK